MTTSYIATVTAYLPIGKDRTVIEINAPAATTIKIKKIRVTFGDGTQTVVADGTKLVSMVAASTSGTGGTTITPTSPDPNAPAAASTVKSGPMYKGTVTAVIDANSIHSGTDFIWHAADEDDKIVITPATMFALVENCSG